MNLQISAILADALSGAERRYRHYNETGGSYVKWGLVEREIHLAVMAGFGSHHQENDDG